MPVCIIHGANDETVRPVNADQVVAQFVAMNRLDFSGRERTASPNASQTSSPYPYQITDYGDAERPAVRKILIESLGHAWSGGDAKYEFNDAQGPDATALMWSFFSLHRRELTRESRIQAAG